VAANYGVNAALWVGAIGCVFSSVFVVFSPLTGMRKLPDGPEAH
jgi:hypothetical protein